MDKAKLKTLLEEVQAGALPIDEALRKLRDLPFKDLGFARLDTHRELRTGYPEVVFCEGKTTEQVVTILLHLVAHGSPVLASRANPELYQAVKAALPKAVYHETARIISQGTRKPQENGGTVLVVSAGTSDLPVAEEAAVVCELLGNKVERLFDSGVAGVHRLLANTDQLFSASVIIVVAGMDGVLPSIVGGLVDKPVIAVPTSVGYGASFDGLAALLTMLNSCAPGVVVVNIDNGFGAGYFASVVNKKQEKE